MRLTGRIDILVLQYLGSGLEEGQFASHMVQPLIVSDRNQDRRSVSSIQLSRGLAVATITRQLQIVRPEFKQHALRVVRICLLPFFHEEQ